MVFRFRVWHCLSVEWRLRTDIFLKLRQYHRVINEYRAAMFLHNVSGGYKGCQGRYIYIYINNWKIDENIDSYITELHTLTKTANYCFS